MRIPVALAFGILVTTVSAQNWALINPAYKYNYSNDGTDTISNQVFVTHIDTLGVDSFRYELNRVGVICETCASSVTSDCNWSVPGLAIRSETPQFMGWSLMHRGQEWLMEGADTLVIFPAAGLGANWIGPGGVVASVVSISETTVFGSMDSLKLIGFSTGDTLSLTLDRGLFAFQPASLAGGSYELIGRDGPISEGEHFPTILDLFDYQVGDVLQ